MLQVTRTDRVQPKKIVNDLRKKQIIGRSPTTTTNDTAGKLSRLATRVLNGKK